MAKQNIVNCLSLKKTLAMGSIKPSCLDKNRHKRDEKLIDLDLWKEMTKNDFNFML